MARNPLWTLFLSSLALRVRAISTCITPVILSNGQSQSFHVEEEKELSLAAHQFCLQNSISSADCERIRVFHQQKCFPRDEITSNRLEGSEQSKDSDSDNESDRDSDRGIETGEPSPSLPLLSHTGIDYSQRVGPVLPVTHQQVTRHLQAFLGETSAEAIQRFCGMMKLLPDQCQQVREAYLTLLKGEKERLRGGEEDGTSATDPSAAGAGCPPQPLRLWHLLRLATHLPHKTNRLS
jgi:hypothetical protein